MLTEENKRQQKEASEQLLECYRCEGDEFLFKIATGDESWIRHYDTEEKRQSMEYQHRNSPKPKKFKTTPSANKFSCPLLDRLSPSRLFARASFKRHIAKHFLFTLVNVEKSDRGQRFCTLVALIYRWFLAIPGSTNNSSRSGYV
ncbi:hypothetical protein QE152_g33071 [Popillia japonica]|uniref:Uncharacterized protein n=1 Tax=Popillia japonica TaxID=7064 RepID=A0AAW1IXY8_POPJA